MKKVLLLLLSVLLINFSVHAAGDIEAGKSQSAKCVGCHGINGRGSIPRYPHLAGQNEVYLDYSMHAYKKGERTGNMANIMRAYVQTLSDQDIANLSAYYSSLGVKE